MRNKVACTCLSLLLWNFAWVVFKQELMEDQIEKLDNISLCQNQLLLVAVCAVPDYNTDMPSFTLYSSSANQTKSIT